MHPSSNTAVQDPPAVAPPREIVSQSEIEQLLAGVAGAADLQAASSTPAAGGDPSEYDYLRRHEFPRLSLFPPAELRRLRERHEEFIGALTARLSTHLGMEVGLQMSKLEAVPF
jgi:flagellar motor switch protein FliM